MGKVKDFFSRDRGGEKAANHGEPGASFTDYEGLLRDAKLDEADSLPRVEMHKLRDTIGEDDTWRSEKVVVVERATEIITHHKAAVAKLAESAGEIGFAQDKGKIEKRGITFVAAEVGSLAHRLQYDIFGKEKPRSARASESGWSYEDKHGKANLRGAQMAEGIALTMASLKDKPRGEVRGDGRYVTEHGHQIWVSESPNAPQFDESQTGEDLQSLGEAIAMISIATGERTPGNVPGNTLGEGGEVKRSIVGHLKRDLETQNSSSVEIPLGLGVSIVVRSFKELEPIRHVLYRAEVISSMDLKERKHRIDLDEKYS